MRKPWIVVLILVLLLPLGALLYVRSAFPPERLRGLVQPRLEAAMQRPVELRSVRLTLVPLAVRLDGLRVLAPPGFRSPALLQVESVRMQLGVLPLLRRRIAARAVDIAAPELWLEQRPDSTWNFAAKSPEQGAASSREAQAEAEAARRGSAFDLDIAALRLRDGRLHYTSQPLDLEVHGPLAAELRVDADRALRDVHVGGWVEIDSLRGGESGRLRSLRRLRLRIEPEAHASVPDSSARIDRLRLFVNDAPIDLEGQARMVAGRPELHLQTRADELDLAQLLQAIPKGSGPLDKLRAAGRARLDLRIDKPATAALVARGSLQLRDGSFEFEGLPEKLTQVRARAEVAGDTLLLRELAAQLGDAPVHVQGAAFEILNPTRTAYDVRLQATGLDLGRLSRFVPLPEGTSLAGRAELDLRARGRAARRDSVFLEGPIRLDGVQVRSPLVLQPVDLVARLQGAGERLRIESASLRAGKSDLTLTGFLVPVLPPGRPRLELQGRSEMLDLVELLPLPDAAAPAGPAGGAAAGKVPPTLLPPLPPVNLQGSVEARAAVLSGMTLRDAHLDLKSGTAGLGVGLRVGEARASDVVLHEVQGDLQLDASGTSGSGRVRAQKGKLQKIEATALESDLRVNGRTLRFTDMRGRAYQGALLGDADLDLGDAAAPKFDLKVRADKVSTGAFLGTLVSPLRDAITGTLDLQSTWKATGPTPESVRRSLTGDGQALSVNGRLEDLPVLNELASLLKLPGLRQMPYRHLGLEFAVDSGRMHMRDVALHGNDADFGVGGSVGLDGSLDLALNVKLSQELSQRYMRGQVLSALGSLFADPDGRLVFDFKVGGTYRAPNLRTDLESTAQRQGVSGLTQTAVRRLLGNLPQLPGVPGTAPPPGDAPQTGTPATGAPPSNPAAPSAADEARRQLQGRLRDLLGRDRKSASDSVKNRQDRSTGPDTTRKP